MWNKACILASLLNVFALLIQDFMVRLTFPFCKCYVLYLEHMKITTNNRILLDLKSTSIDEIKRLHRTKEESVKNSPEGATLDVQVNLKNIQRSLGYIAPYHHIASFHLDGVSPTDLATSIQYHHHLCS